MERPREHDVPRDGTIVVRTSGNSTTVAAISMPIGGAAR